jgi:hypothetical protein
MTVDISKRADPAPSDCIIGSKMIVASAAPIKSAKYNLLIFSDIAKNINAIPAPAKKKGTEEIR